MFSYVSLSVWQETILKEQIEGLVEEDEEKEEAVNEDEEDVAVGAITLADKKTERQRKKEKAEKIKVNWCLNFRNTCSDKCWKGSKCIVPLTTWDTHPCLPLRISQEQQRLADRRQIDQRQQLFQLRSIKTSIKQREEKTKARQKLRKAKQEAQKAQPRRLGKLKYMLNVFTLS